VSFDAVCTCVLFLLANLLLHGLVDPSRVVMLPQTCPSGTSARVEAFGRPVRFCGQVRFSIVCKAGRRAIDLERMCSSRLFSYSRNYATKYAFATCGCYGQHSPPPRCVIHSQLNRVLTDASTISLAPTRLGLKRL